MRILIVIIAIMLSLSASAQKDLFMKEFNEVNNWFFVQKNIMLIQKYIYYNDSSMVNPVDSSSCTIIKNGTAIHYKVKGMESFSDSGYMVKISQAQKVIYVSKAAKTDSTQLSALLNQGFGEFRVFTKTPTTIDISSWELTGGQGGVNSAILVMDVKNHEIKFLEIFMAGDHPLVSPFRKSEETATAVMIKVDYQYMPNVKKYEIKKLNDFIIIQDNGITPATSYENYQVKLLTENK